MRTASLLVLSVLSILFPAIPAGATMVTLSDGNSVLRVDASGERGFDSWTVDGVDILNQQWFWYRIGNGAARSIDELTLSGVAVSGGATCSACTVDLLYTASNFTIDIISSLRGGAWGSGTADVSRQIRITNRLNTSLDFHFFEYADYDLDPAAGRVMVSPTLPGMAMRPSNQPAVFDSMAGDGTWAFQWDKVITRRGTLVINEDDFLVPVLVPEPGSIALAGTAVLFAVWRLRRRRI